MAELWNLVLAYNKEYTAILILILNVIDKTSQSCKKFTFRFIYVLIMLIGDVYLHVNGKIEGW